MATNTDVIDKRFMPSHRNGMHVVTHWSMVPENGWDVISGHACRSARVRWLHEGGSYPGEVIIHTDSGGVENLCVMEFPERLGPLMPGAEVVILGHRREAHNGYEYDGIVLSLRDCHGPRLLAEIIDGGDVVSLNDINPGTWHHVKTVALPVEGLDVITTLMFASGKKRRAETLVDNIFQLLAARPTMVHGLCPESTAYANPLAFMRDRYPGNLMCFVVHIIEHINNDSIIQASIEGEIERRGDTTLEERNNIFQEHHQGNNVITGKVVEHILRNLFDGHGITYGYQKRASAGGYANRTDLVVDIPLRRYLMACRNSIRGDRSGDEPGRHVVSPLAGSRRYASDVPSDEILGHMRASGSVLVGPEWLVEEGGPLSRITDGLVISLHSFMHNELSCSATRNYDDEMCQVQHIPLPTIRSVADIRRYGRLVRHNLFTDVQLQRSVTSHLLDP